MNTRKLRSKAVVIPTVATLALLTAGGVFWTASADDQLEGSDRDRVGAAAVDAVGGGTVVGAETSDDAGEAYEVEVRLEDGTEVDVALDQDLAVVSEERDDDSDDRALDQAERRSAEEAALAEVGGGTVLDVEASDDRGVAYEVEVRDADGAEWDVDLDEAFEVVDRRADD